MLFSLCFQAVAKLMSVDCRCHGVSGSCAVKTCWKTMSSFEKIGRFLKDKYENSIQISDRLKKKLRRKEKSQRKIPIGKEDLLYVNKSPNYCVEDQKLGIPGTQGRECNRTSQGPEGCNLLCCGRGYNTHVVRHVERCECKFVWCCYVRCRRCETMTDVHTCKWDGEQETWPNHPPCGVHAAATGAAITASLWDFREIGLRGNRYCQTMVAQACLDWNDSWVNIRLPCRDSLNSKKDYWLHIWRCYSMSWDRC